MRSPRFWIPILVVSFLFPLLVWRGRAGAGEPEPAATSVAAVRVRTVAARASATPGSEDLRATGTLVADREGHLAFPVAGVVLRTERDRGDRVEAGDVLAVLDPVPYRAAVREAEARVAFLEKEEARARGLVEKEAVAEQQWDAAVADLEAARAQLERARWNLERTELRAPFAARVRERFVEPGQVVDGSVPAYELLAVDELEVEVGVAASDLAAVLAGDGTVRVRSVDGVGERPGRIDHAPVAGDPRAGSVPVRVRVDNRDGALLPGLLVEVIFPVESAPAPSGVRVPLSALQVGAEGPFVFRVEDGRVHAVNVRPGAVRRDEVTVEGLEAGALVVDAAPDRLRDGDTVAVDRDR